MDERDRKAILGQGATRPETPRDRAVRRTLETDLPGSPVTGRPLRRRLRPFRPDPHTYLSALGGPLPWMVRLREIDRLVAEHERLLEEAWDELSDALWENVLQRMGGTYAVVARMPFDPSLN